MLTLTKNAVLANKYAPGERVYIIFNLGSHIKAKAFEIKGMVMQKIRNEEPEYLYAYEVDGEGNEGAVNLSFVKEDLVFTDIEDAKKKIAEVAEDLKKQYVAQILKVKEEAEKRCASLTAEMKKINTMQMETDTNPPSESDGKDNPEAVPDEEAPKAD